METTLQDIARDYHRQFEDHLYDPTRTAFVFPTRRAGLYFHKYLATLSSRPLFAPTVKSLNDFIFNLSGRKRVDRLGLLFTLYHLYVECSRSKETFDDFIYWGEMLLSDFDDVDKYLVDPRMLFRNVTDLRQIESDYSYLTLRQIEAIRSFWSPFQPRTEGRNESEFRALWQILYELYERLHQHLKTEGRAYEGMAYRLVADRADELTPQSVGYDHLVFVGLYGLSSSEKKIVGSLVRAGFARDIPDDADDAPPVPESGLTIEVVGVPSAIGQAKYMHTLLSRWAAEESLDGDAALRTAVILPDETLLVPLLNAIPESIPQVNVTMGYPLAATPVATLVNAFLSLQHNVRQPLDGEPTFYHKDVQTLLSHPYIRAAEPQSAAILKDIIQGNRVHVPATILTVTPLLADLFTPVADTSRWSDYIARTLVLLADTGAVPDGEDTEALRYYHRTLIRLGDIIRQARLEMLPDTYTRLLRRAVAHTKIPFSGEPLAGLQIMGFPEEPRVLQFDRLAILSTNEGTFPPRHLDNTFIPYNLRQGFGLPTGDRRDSLWMHHFYRLLRHARHVSLVYDTRTGGNHTGEVSRFVYQLRYRHNYPLIDRQITHPIVSIRSRPRNVEKTDDILLRLNRFADDEGRPALSASLINVYLDCPLRFYYTVVDGAGEESAVNEAINGGTFGSILHDTLQCLYEPLCGRSLDAATLHALARNGTEIARAIAQAFAKVHFRTPGILHPLTGQNFLVAQMVRKYAAKVLTQDARLAPFRYLASEQPIEARFPISDGRQVRLRGFIDRLDTVRDATRIVDYKSGSGERIIPSYDALFDPTLHKRPKEAMQVLLYAWMYLRQPDIAPDTPIHTEIYYMRQLFAPSFDSSLRFRVGYNRSIPLGLFQPHETPFEEALRTCLDRIYDPAVPFTPTLVAKHCSYCPFASTCPPRH